MTLKGHLTRLTSELSDHHHLLEKLRSLRDTDVRALKDKSRDVDNLRQEVERLGGEVEVLRGVVEEGLKQRREVREQSVEQSHSSHSNSLRLRDDLLGLEDQHDGAEHSDGESNDELSSVHSAPSPTPSPQRQSRLADRTMRTDQATLGSPHVEGNINEQPFIDSHELERISEEVSERRIERSVSTSTVSQLSIRQASPVPSLVRSRSRQNARQAEVADASDEEIPVNRVSSRSVPQTQESRPRRTRLDEEAQGVHGTGVDANDRPAEVEPPIPRIRGPYLERLFFSAPDHHEHTCTVCNRRQRHKAQRDAHTQWDADVIDCRNLKERLRDAELQADDEGFMEEDRARARQQRTFAKGKQRAGTEEDRVPPQTVLARVLRELEDDFKHYKE